MVVWCEKGPMRCYWTNEIRCDKIARPHPHPHTNPHTYPHPGQTRPRHTIPNHNRTHHTTQHHTTRHHATPHRTAYHTTPHTTTPHHRSRPPQPSSTPYHATPPQSSPPPHRSRRGLGGKCSRPSATSRRRKGALALEDNIVSSQKQVERGK